MTTLVPFGETYINPDHVVSVIPERVTGDGACNVRVHLTAGPTVDYMVPGRDMSAAVVRVAELINQGADRVSGHTLRLGPLGDAAVADALKGAGR